MSVIKIPHSKWISIAIKLLMSYDEEFQDDPEYSRTLLGKTSIILNKKFKARHIPANDNDEWYIISFDNPKYETLFRLRYSEYITAVD